MAEKKINGRTYKVEPLRALDALKLQARILKFAGPALNKFAPMIGEIREAAAGAASDEAKDKLGTIVISAIGELMAGADPDGVAVLLKDICEVAYLRRPSGSYDPVDFDGDFTQDQAAILPVAGFVLKEVFGNFLSGFKGITPRA